MSALLALAAAFLLGAFPTSYLLVRWKTGRDIRTLGSGNPGATNVFRTVGRAPGIAVLAADLLKGLLAASVLPAGALPFEPETAHLVLGVAAILGHTFTPFLGFRGGKGVATGAGVALAVYPLNFLLAFAVWWALLLTFRYMSVASIAAAYVFAASVVFTLSNRWHWLIAFACAVFITWTHRGNIRRLLRGEEPPFLVNKTK
jgi:glycerol-3-phosphate acyltransferase PlsY